MWRVVEANEDQRGTDACDGARIMANFDKLPGVAARDLDSGLIALNLAESVKLVDVIPLLHKPFQYLNLGYSFSNISKVEGHDRIAAHDSAPRLSSDSGAAKCPLSA